MNQQAEVTINLPPHDRLIKARKWLEEELGYTGISADTALNRTLETFCTLMQRGRNHQMSGARDEAALYWVIALDFLFGTKAGVTDSVAERVAVLTHMAENRTYAEQNKRMRELYDARSRYVHQGKPIDELQASEIERVASQVLWSFLSVSADAVFATTDEWLREVDFVQAAIQAGREVSEADLRGIGVRTDLAAIERCEIPKKA